MNWVQGTINWKMCSSRTTMEIQKYESRQR